jgi:nitrogenase subunit NifH
MTDKKKKLSKKESIQKLSNNIKKNIPNKKEEEEVNLDDIIQEELLKIELEKEFLKKCSSEQLGEWVIDKFFSMVEVINYTIQQDFLNAENTQARFYKIYFIAEFWKLLEQYEIDISIETRDYLAKKQEAEILDILVFLNFI